MQGIVPWTKTFNFKQQALISLKGTSVKGTIAIFK